MPESTAFGLPHWRSLTVPRPLAMRCGTYLERENFAAILQESKTCHAPLLGGALTEHYARLI